MLANKESQEFIWETPKSILSLISKIDLELNSSESYALGFNIVFPDFETADVVTKELESYFGTRFLYSAIPPDHNTDVKWYPYEYNFAIVKTDIATLFLETEAENGPERVTFDLLNPEQKLTDSEFEALDLDDFYTEPVKNQSGMEYLLYPKIYVKQAIQRIVSLDFKDTVFVTVLCPGNVVCNAVLKRLASKFEDRILYGRFEDGGENAVRVILGATKDTCMTIFPEIVNL